MNWDSNIDPMSLGRPELTDPDKKNLEEQSETSKLKGVRPETILQQQAETLATTTHSSISREQVIVGPGDPTAKRVAMAAVGSTRTASSEVQEVDQKKTETKQKKWGFKGMNRRLDENNSSGTGLASDSARVEKLVEAVDVTSHHQVSLKGEPWPHGGPDVSGDQTKEISEVAEAFKKGDTLLLYIGEGGKRESRSLSLQDLDSKKIIIFNPESNTVAHAGHSESEIRVFKQDPMLRNCRFIGLSPESLAALRPHLLKIINANKAKAGEVKSETDEIKAGSYRSEPHLGHLIANKQKTKSDARNTSKDANVLLSDGRDAYGETIKAEKKHIEQLHIEEAEESKNELWTQERKMLIEKRRRERELNKERIDKREIR